MSKLQIWRAKPNPAGKDKSHGTPKPRQLNGEWVEIQNTAGNAVDLGGITLSHTLFDANGKPEPKPEKYWTAPKNLVLGGGEVLRVHTGHASAGLDLEDENGTDHHAFAEHGNFKLNNAEGDKLYLSTATPDSAYYDPHVREGAHLTRVGDKLVDLEAGSTSTGKVWRAPAVVGASRDAA